VHEGGPHASFAPSAKALLQLYEELAAAAPAGRLKPPKSMVEGWKIRQKCRTRACLCKNRGLGFFTVICWVGQPAM
jgi:hypothetical protein